MICDSCKYFARYCKSHHWDIDGIVTYCGRYCYSENPKNKVQSEHLNKQEAKADAGKPQLTLVPRQILFDIAEVRMFGTAKYGDPDNWEKVEIQRYRDAAFRHFMAYLDDPQGNDKESGLSHLAHLACNIAFLCELEKKKENETDETADN